VRTLVAGKKLCAVVKADAYGLGAVPVSRALAEAGVDSLGVVMLDEAVQLRRAGIVTRSSTWVKFSASMPAMRWSMTFSR
jgi:alanine racemase